MKTLDPKKIKAALVLGIPVYAYGTWEDIKSGELIFANRAKVVRVSASKSAKREGPFLLFDLGPEGRCKAIPSSDDACILIDARWSGNE